LGQASAALLARSAIGLTAEDLHAATSSLRQWLGGEVPSSGDWPGLEALRPAIPHTARHAAILLAFEAAAAAAADARQS
jgi:NifU-like protein involved in Fe-S cluster formation